MHAYVYVDANARFGFYISLFVYYVYDRSYELPPLTVLCFWLLASFVGIAAVSNLAQCKTQKAFGVRLQTV